MELCSLHPISDDLAGSYVASLERYESQPAGGIDLHRVTAGLARAALQVYPAFAADGLCLTTWEARVDRGISMLIRPPARLFIDAGFPVPNARSMPIRLDLAGAPMGGGYIPARLVPQAGELLDRNMRRNLKRMREAEMNAVLIHAIMMEAVRYSAARGLGLYEAVGVIAYDDPATWPPGSLVQTQPSDRALLDRIEEAARPEPEPGLVSRVIARLRGSSITASNSE